MLLLLMIIMMILMYCYRTAFYVKPGHHEDPYNLPQNEQYQPYYHAMVHLVDALNNEPYEAVSIKSFDGLTLRGRLYIYDENAPIELHLTAIEPMESMIAAVYFRLPGG